ncbi:hypothetical protein [Streptomyces halobius]|uniref:Integral membrane protein n=1 Tax=Streptomyces halobius TaxID=2879846 RepID=A0ABY4MCG9_9ACTN|nr:hypothetical protein [Streptomyces halobius]UQA95012.1 hypothetical protein K9S39_26970 [Streptomyces halobius]
MHAPAPAHPPYQPPARGTVVTLRVLFVAVTVLSLGFLAWAALLRAALVQRRPLGWWLFGADLALLVLLLLSGTHPVDDWRTNAQVGAILAQMAGAVAYYLVVDLRAARTSGYGPLYGAAPYGEGYGAPYREAAGGGYGCPQAAYSAGPAGYQAGPSRHQAAPPGHPAAPSPSPSPSPYGPSPPGPIPLHAQETHPCTTPTPAPTANPCSAPQAGPGCPPAPPQERPQRIDRVRAELDELSDYLRKEEGR